MLTARTEVSCVLDYDIKVNIYTICKHMFAEQEQDQGGAAIAQIMFDIQDLKRTGDIFGSVNKLATSAEEEKITSCQSENVLGFWPKNCSPKATQKMFCMEFFFFNSKPNRAEVLTLHLLCCGIQRQGQASKVSDIYKFMGPERLQPNVLREPAIVHERTPSITFERLQSQKEVSKCQKYF